MRSLAFDALALQQWSLSTRPQLSSLVYIKNLKPNSIKRFYGSSVSRTISSCKALLRHQGFNRIELECKHISVHKRRVSLLVPAFSNYRSTERRGAKIQCQAGLKPSSDDENDALVELVKKDVDIDGWQWTKTNKELGMTQKCIF